MVQQAEGRVSASAQTKGVAINDDTGLEREADEMGARAARGERVRGAAAPGAVAPGRQTQMAPGGPDAAGVVQRKVGLEIESTPDWQAYNAEYQAIVGQHLVLYQEGKFRVETELSGKLEIVIEPPAENTEELLQIMDRVVEVARAIEVAKVRTKQTVRDDFASEHLKQEVHKQVKLFPISEAVPGALEGVYISKGPGQFFGGFQATVGVHLSAIPFLFERLQRGDFISDYPSGDTIRGAAQQGVHAREASVDMPYTDYHQISPEMEGLLDLIYYYIVVGSQPGRRPFPKGITQVMARTNFGKMFSMTREAPMFAAHPALWVKYVTEAAGLNPDTPVFQGRFGDDDEHTSTVDITIGKWLLGMVKGVDRLSVKGDGPKILKTMGDMKKTDDLGAKGEENRGAILELRGLDLVTIPITEWIPFAYKISHIVDQLNSRVEDPLKANYDVERAGNGGALSWSPLEAKREAGQDVLLMAVEAMHAPFVAQVVGLMMRAKARARSVEE